MSETFYYPSSTSAASLKGKIIIVPVVSVANVAQLAVDLLISTLDLTLIGTFDPSYLIPVVGAREDGLPGFTTPLELYGRDGLNIVVVQQRSPVMKSMKQSFVNSLLEFVQGYQLEAMIFVSGVDLSNRSDEQMRSPIYKLCPRQKVELESTPLSRVAMLPTYTFAPSEAIPNAGVASELPFIPGGGITRRILSSIPTSWSIPTACVLQFVLEGDNRADAHHLARALSNMLDLDRHVTSWKQPKSWAAGLFGTTHDQSLYG